MVRRRYSAEESCVAPAGQSNRTPDERTKDALNPKQSPQTVPVVAPAEPGKPVRSSGRIPPTRRTPRSTASSTRPRT